MVSVKEMIVEYQIVVNSNRRLSFSPIDLRYFDDHFVCQPMKNRWIAPPFNVLGKSYKPADFMIWMQRSPILSEKAMQCLKGNSKNILEFLPFYEKGEKRFFALNVLSTSSTDLLYKKHPHSVIYAGSDFGELVRDNELSGVGLAIPEPNLNRRIALGESVNAFPGLVG